MAIYYPLLMPGAPGFQALTLRMQNITVVNMSPFTAQQQAYEFPGEWWEADLTLPPIKDRATAEAWIAFLASLRGQYGTFLLGDPAGRTPLGAAFGSPLIPSATLISPAAAPILAIAGWDPSIPAILMPGDYLEIGTNFLTAPNDFTNAAWAAIGCTIAPNAAMAPDGTVTADRITAAGGSSSLGQSTSSPPILARGQNFTFGIWLRASAPVSLTIEILRENLSAIWAAIGQQTLEVGTAWGYFTLSAALDVAASSVQVLMAPPASESWYAWGASLDDGVTDRRLHKVMTETDSDANGNAIFDIWPRLREAPAEAAPISVQGARGMFRLASDMRQMTLDSARVYGIGFKAVESL